MFFVKTEVFATEKMQLCKREDSVNFDRNYSTSDNSQIHVFSHATLMHCG